MCVSCGCGEGFDDHGDADNITADQSQSVNDDDLIRAADAQGISVEEVRRNIEAAKNSA